MPNFSFHCPKCRAERRAMMGQTYEKKRKEETAWPKGHAVCKYFQLILLFHISCRPSRARKSVTSSAYSSWLPTGMP